ncbi:MAG: hypothetical protein ACREJ5_24850, partial [Geminicoccaceae bacterium]
QRIARAAWRLERAERLEVELFEEHHIPTGTRGLALIRDGNGTRSFDTLLRYRGAASAELMRALRTLKALQAEAAMPLRAAGPAAVLTFEPKRTRGTAIGPNRGGAEGAAREKNPNEPKPCSRPGDPVPAGPPWQGPEQRSAGPAPVRPNEPEAGGNPGGSRPVPAQMNPTGAGATRPSGAG